MSQQHIDIWKQAADAFSASYAAIGDRGGAASPCKGWSADDVVAHAVDVQSRVGSGMIGADIAEGAEWPAVCEAITAALAVEGALEGMSDHPAFGQMPKSVMFGIATNDLLLHAWDVARAVGADETLPAEAVTMCLAGLQRMPSEAIRADGRFGPEIEVGEDADEQSRLLAYAGRRP